MPTSEPWRAPISEDAHSERTLPGAQSGRVPPTVVCWLPSRLNVITFVVKGLFFLRAAADTVGRLPISRSTWADTDSRRAARPRRTAFRWRCRSLADTPARARVRAETVPT